MTIYSSTKFKAWKGAKRHRVNTRDFKIDDCGKQLTSNIFDKHWSVRQFV